MDVGRGERLRQHVARLVGEEARRWSTLERAARARRSSACRAPKPIDHDCEVVEVAQEGRRADERVEILRVTDVARVHDDERPGEPVPRAQALSRARGVIASVSTQFGITRRCGPAARPSPRAAAASSRRSRRCGRRGAGRGRRARAAGRSTSGFSSRLSSTAISGKTSWLTTTSGTPNRRATSERDVADHRRVGHAEDEVRARSDREPAQPAPRPR